jgi:hypothetical protein
VTVLARCVLACTISFLIVISPAAAHFDNSDKYTHDDDDCDLSGHGSDHKDPINVVFYNWGTWGRAVNQIQTHANWFVSGAEPQWFRDHGECYVMHDDLADGTGSRYHVRFRGQHSDQALDWPTWGNVHHEDAVSLPQCLPNGGHAVDSNGPNGSGYDQGRAQLSWAMWMGGHSYYYAWWGNTGSFVQCDGDTAASDGNTVYISLHQVNH